MGFDLVAHREQAMDRADRALDAAWPERKSENYVREMQSAAEDLENIVDEMKVQGIQNIEQSRTCRYLGSIYSDLAPALGKTMFQKSKAMYMQSEALLEGYEDKLEEAKLNFNYGNTFRQMDPDDIEQLQESKLRFLFAKKIFAIQEPQYLQQVDTALWSVESLLNIAPLVSKVVRAQAEMSALQEDLEKGGDLMDITKKAHELITRDGGVLKLFFNVQMLIDELPPELKQTEKFGVISQKMDALAGLIIGGESIDEEESRIIMLLNDRLEAELKEGKVSEDRAQTLHGLIGQLSTILHR